MDNEGYSPRVKLSDPITVLHLFLWLRISETVPPFHRYFGVVPQYTRAVLTFYYFTNSFHCLCSEFWITEYNLNPYLYSKDFQ
jgi:hypothetical protein